MEETLYGGDLSLVGEEQHDPILGLQALIVMGKDEGALAQDGADAGAGDVAVGGGEGGGVLGEVGDRK